MRTNFDKLTGWDADYYKSLTNEDCIVCLTERQIYVLGQTLEQITWHRTRWTGDKSGLDFDEISSEIQYQLAERMTCQTLTELLEQIQALQASVDIILQQSFEGDNTIDVDTTVLDDVFSGAAQAAATIFETELCDFDAKSAIYGACSALVRGINQNNVDFLESVSQAGNVTDQSKRILSGIPLIGLLPLDEIADYGTFIIDELLEEYNATVDEDLLQTVICDLFCIAVANDCHLDFADLLNYFAGKVSPTLGNATTTFLSLVQFAIAGTFAGDAYFYYLCYFQLWVAYADSEFFGNHGIQSYAMTGRAGLNSPDPDWEIFCIDCPEPPVYPNLINVRCQDALQLGTITNIDANHWNLVSQLHIGAHYCFIQDDSLLTSATFKILAITIITSTGLNNGSQYSDPCVDTEVFSWIPGQIGALNRFGYMFSSNAAFEIEIEVSEIGA